MPKEDVSRKRKVEEKLKAAKKAKVQKRDILDVSLMVFSYAGATLILFIRNIIFIPWRDKNIFLRRDMIWQRTPEDRLTWKRRAEAFAQL